MTVPPSDSPNRYRIRSYSYKPIPKFTPEVPSNPHGLYLGMEIEIELVPTTARMLSVTNQMSEWFNSHMKEYEHQGLFYYKSDSSLSNGVEIVTHPFEPEWGMENFPAERLGLLKEDYGFQEYGRHSGTHLHLSKTAFDKKRLWNFMQIHNHLDYVCGAIGGRGTRASYGSFFPTVSTRDRKAKTGASKEHWDDLMDRASTGYSPNGWGRDAVNLWPDQTIELRYPRGTLVPEELMALIEWTQCLFNFSDPEEWEEAYTDNDKRLMSFIKAHKTEWPNLATHADRVMKATTIPTERWAGEGA
jgi:hypothetical protein